MSFSKNHWLVSFLLAVIVFLACITGCEDSLHKDAQRLTRGMTRTDVSQLLKKYVIFTQGTNSANLHGATYIFEPEQTVSYWISYVPKHRLFHNFASCKVYFDGRDVIVAYSYDRPD